MRALRLVVPVSFVGLVCLAVVSAAPAPPGAAGKPDLIVADLRVDGNDLVLEVQNQGPGLGKRGTFVEVQFTTRGKGKPASHTVEMPVPVAEFAVEQARVPIANLGVADAADLGVVTVVLDPARKIEEERTGNNRYFKHIGGGGRSERGDYKKAAGLPDLVITDITAD